VSCVSGTTFCVAIVGDMDNIINGSDIGQAALVTTDAGQTWSTDGGLHWSDRTPSAWASDAHWSPNSIDCVSGSVSCLSVSTCVAVTDNAIWVTSDDGGLTPAS
jgi:hypothetical protein